MRLGDVSFVVLFLHTRFLYFIFVIVQVVAFVY